MSQRLTVADVVASRFPATVGLCSDDLPGVCAAINSAVERLSYCRELGDEGWTAAWTELAFDITQDDPFIVLPYGVSRIEAIDLCTFPIPLHNPFFEFLRFGSGRWPKSTCATTRCAPLAGYDRGVVPVFVPVEPPGMKVRVRLTDGADEGKRVLLGYQDANAVPVRTLDGTVQVDGEFLDLTAPFVDSANEVTLVTAVTKDITLGRVLIYQLNVATQDETLISTMEPGQTIAAFRKYYIGGVPTSCCNPPSSTPGTVQVQVLAKLDFTPVRVLTDYVLIPNLEALIHEAQAVRFSGMDSGNGSQQAEYHHRAAVRLLQGQLIAEYGKVSPAVNFAPFGTARLALQRVGTCW